MSLLEVSNLRKTFDTEPTTVSRRWWSTWHSADRSPVLLKDAGTSRAAVAGVSFEVDAGEAVGVIGESGSGKSTLAALLARLLDPSAGSIHFAGEHISTVPARTAASAPWRGAIQMVFQDARGSLDPLGTAYDAIAAALRNARLGRDACRRRVFALADEVDLPAGCLQQRPHQLSGGEAARVGIARAIASEPKLLILDEPTAALDVSVRASVLLMLDRLRRDRRTALLFISHDLNLVRLLCGRTLVMHHGHLIEAGTTESIVEAPRHPQTRRLLNAIARIP